MGDYAAARSYYEQALAIKREVLGEKHADTANSLDNLGVATSEMGDYAAARRYHEQALAIRREVLGKSTTVLLTRYSTWAMTPRIWGITRPRVGTSSRPWIYREVLGKSTTPPLPR